MDATYRNGKICYVEILANDIARSADLYKRVLGRSSAERPGLLLYGMLDSVAATIDAVIANGDVIVQPIGADAPEITARFRDPGGNVIGLYQQPG